MPIALNLPNDLSPYGIFWQQKMVRIGDQTTFHIVSNYQDPNPHDDLINEVIDTWVSNQEVTGPYETWAFIDSGAVNLGIGKRRDSGMDPIAQFDWLTGQRTK